MRIADVCSLQTNSGLNLMPLQQVTEQGDGTVTKPNVLGMYLLPTANISEGPGSATYITVPAEQIHKTVHQVARQQPTLTQPVSVNQTPIGLPASFVSSPATQAGVPSQSATLSAVSGQQRGAEIGSFVDKLILQNETILKGHDVTSVRPRLRAASSYSQKVASPKSTQSTVQPEDPPVFKSPRTHKGGVIKSLNFPTERNFLLKRELSAGQLASAIVRPASPTSMCLLHPEDESLFASSLVQIHVKKEQSDSQLRDMICGLVCKAKVKVSGNSALPLDTDLYWCNFCAFKCETKVDFLRHVMSHRFNCWFCTFQAFSRADIVRHCLEKHSSFDAETWSFCSLLNDHLKLALGTTEESPTIKTEPQDEECLPGRRQESEGEALVLSDSEDADTGLKDVESWNCRHCDFVSQDSKLIQIHCTIMHPMLNKSAKAVTVSTALAQQIRKLDVIRKLHLEKGEKEFLKSTDSGSSCSRSSFGKEEEEEIDDLNEGNEGQDMEEEDEDQEEKESEINHEVNVAEEKSVSKQIPIYECYNCHGQSIKLKEVRKHLSNEHLREPFIAIDLLNVRRKQARYVVFCPRPGCFFYSRSQKGFSEHITSDDCVGKKHPKLHASILESLSKTALFAQNSMRTIIRSRPASSGKVKRMMCHQQNCRYQCAKPALMKNHMIRVHSNHKPTYTLAEREGKKVSKTKIHFCPICAGFHCNSARRLCVHLVTKHSISSHSADIGSYTIRKLLDHSKQVWETVKGEKDEGPDGEQLDDMMETYLEDETQSKMAASGSDLRHAAVKADVRLKTKFRSPRCYKCKFCKYQCLGVNLMRTHIHDDHHGVSMIATDVGMRRNKKGGRVYLCPRGGCHFATKNDDEWLHHCAQKHSLGNLPIPRDVSELDIRMFSKFPPTYECLYCEGSVVRDTPTLMRLHLLKCHKGEVVVMRDVVARKQCKASRIYMCNRLSCDFITKHQTDYEAHVSSCDIVPNGHVSPNADMQADSDSETVHDHGISSEMEYNAVADASQQTDEVGDIDQPTLDYEDMDNELDVDENASHDEEMTEVIIQDTTTQDIVKIKLEVPDL